MAIDTHRIDSPAGRAVHSCDHLVHFYEHDGQLIEAVGSYLCRALRAGGTAVILATAEHRGAFAKYVHADGVDLGPGDERVVALDGAATLARLMHDGQVEPAAFDELIGGVIRGAHDRGAPVHAYGEMVGLLWQDGNVAAAIELERLWNELAAKLPFSLFCGYRAEIVSHPADVNALETVCHLHSTVVGPMPGRELTPADGLASTELRAKFAADPAAPSAARRLLTTALRTQGCEDAFVEASVLVLSELVTNAVRHVGAPFTVEAALAGPTLRLAVRDVCPPLEEGTMVVLPTHGLAVVDHLASCWGVEGAPEGKVVWAELHAANV